MPRPEKTVVVLGAGFTRAYFELAPLITDDYGGVWLQRRFRPFATASRVLRIERKGNPGGDINLERLLSRLDGGMPYDREDGPLDELDLLRAHLVDILIGRLEEALEDRRHAKDLARFAEFCVRKRITCLTFNYDDALDRALWDVAEVVVGTSKKPYWHPDSGYGFFCKPSLASVEISPVFMDRPRMYLLKLHGSLNWFAPRGQSRPYPVGSIVHHEPWLPFLTFQGLNYGAVRGHLERQPFIVPPLLFKSAINGEPILKVVWERAADELRAAKHVIFVGYSLPTTDLGARTLFRESVRASASIRVVTLGRMARQRRHAISTYQQVFPQLRPAHFTFSDARLWIRRFLKRPPPHLR